MGIEDLIARDEVVHRQIFGAWAATIATTASSLTQEVQVVIPAIDPHSLWGPCKWMPRAYNETVNVAEGIDTHADAEPAHNIIIPHLLFPSAGDEALIVFDNYRTVWVVCWWPT